ncbi:MULTISPECIES: glycosyltransferase family 4 protein [unclassified Ectothiorhodospira]|uniref:glycosyltransferase family 4 protein n=1 Tax=unclassified Ectothiorhodospira TaxID=2684909 RepID=UPI001EE8F79C|nr:MULTISPECIES: glycosyltransferase family 4 protein [unclassified Ectothiorhodospira]MCG5516955.1 glycosyltransferase family 4 protein [Ectothiorhodospira sp. 9100]MCG5519873.1 glycosyltransferase family 4 protein [Ectothiorhodospira sp. 9905]
MNTGIENLAWGLAERGFHIHILSGGSLPECHGYQFPDAVIYHFTKNPGAPGDHITKYLSLRELYNFDIVVGWIKNLYPLVSADASISGRPKFIANEGQITSRISQFVFIKFLASLNHAFKVRGFSVSQFQFGCRSAKSLGRSVDYVVAISEVVGQCARRVYGVDERHVRVIPRGVDVNVFRPGNIDRNSFVSGRPRLIFTGNVAESKGLGDVVDALALLEESVDWVICGKDQGYLSIIRRRLKGLKGKHQLIYLGTLSQEELVLELQSSDIFVFPSWSEGLGKSLLEAMSCGLPVVVSDIMAFDGIVSSGLNGTMVRRKSPSSIADALLSYLNNGALRVTHGCNARQKIEREFSRCSEVNSWSSLIDDVTH